jgi:hypothetical protein
MAKTKFDPRSLLGKDLIQAAGEAFVQQTHSIRVVAQDGKSVHLDEEETAKQDPKCYDVNVDEGKIVFVHLRPWNEHQHS